MNAETSEVVARPPAIRKSFIAVVVLILLSLFVLITGLTIFVEPPLRLVFGWIPFLRRVIPQVTVDSAGLGLGVDHRDQGLVDLSVANPSWFDGVFVRGQRPGNADSEWPQLAEHGIRLAVTQEHVARRGRRSRFSSVDGDELAVRPAQQDKAPAAQSRVVPVDNS